MNAPACGGVSSPFCYVSASFITAELTQRSLDTRLSIRAFSGFRPTPVATTQCARCMTSRQPMPSSSSPHMYRPRPNRIDVSDISLASVKSWSFHAYLHLASHCMKHHSAEHLPAPWTPPINLVLAHEASLSAAQRCLSLKRGSPLMRLIGRGTVHVLRLCAVCDLRSARPFRNQQAKGSHWS